MIIPIHHLSGPKVGVLSLFGRSKKESLQVRKTTGRRKTIYSIKVETSGYPMKTKLNKNGLLSEVFPNKYYICHLTTTMIHETLQEQSNKYNIPILQDHALAHAFLCCGSTLGCYHSCG
jgi:hypothetical protein